MMREEVLRVRDNATLSEHDRLRILKEKYRSCPLSAAVYDRGPRS